MSRLAIQSVDSAAPEARERLASAAKASGFLPNLLGVLANAPAALEAYQTVGKINAKSSFTPAEREVVQLTAATQNECDFCQAGHSKVSLKVAKLSPDNIRALRRADTLDDAKLDALATFTRAVIHAKGDVSDAELKAFRDAGYNDQNVVEVVLGVSLQTLCNYANRLARTPINSELQEYFEQYA